MRFGGPVFVPVRPRLMFPLSGPARSFRSGRAGVRRRIEWSVGAGGAAASAYRSVDGGRSGMPSGACRPSLFVSVAGARACDGAVVPVRFRIFDVVGRRPSEESFFCRGTVRLRSLRLSRSVKSRRPNVFSKRGVAVVRPRGGSACRAGPGGVACARVANASLSRAPSSGLPEHRIGRGIFVLCFFVYFCRNAVPALRTKRRRQTHASGLPSIGFRKNEFSL